VAKKDSEKSIANFELDRALANAIELVKFSDKYIQYYEPFKLIKEDPEKTGCVLNRCLETIFSIKEIIAPFLPETARKISEQCGESLTVGGSVHKGEALFPRLEERN
jgi:methionyl-tRNA synthetase